MPTCCAPGCNRTEKTTTKCSFFCLPWGDKERMQIWLEKLNLVTRPAANAKICMHHFESKDIEVNDRYVIAPHLYPNPKRQLSKTAIPTIFDHKQGPTKREFSEKRAEKRRRVEVLGDCLQDEDNGLQDEDNDSTWVDDETNVSSNSLETQTSTPDTLDVNKSYLGSERSCRCTCMCYRCTIPQAQTVSTQTDIQATAVKSIQVKPHTLVKGSQVKPQVTNKTVNATTPTNDANCQATVGTVTTSAGSSADTPNVDRLLPHLPQPNSSSSNSSDSDSDYDPDKDTDRYSSEDNCCTQRVMSQLTQHTAALSEDVTQSHKQTKFLCFEENLRKLFKRCQRCGACINKCIFDYEKRGSLLKVMYTCKKGHHGSWNSQPLLNNRMAAGNLALACSILFSGLTYERIREFSEILQLPILSESHFYTLQKVYLVPVIHTSFIHQKESFIGAFGNEEVVLIGDGRSDSPGFSAKYGTYTLMEVITGAILTFTVCHVGLSDSSRSMEVDGCKETITDLEDHGMHIKVLGTDRNGSVIRLLSTTFPNIVHQFDVYHLDKSIRKRLLNEANKRGAFALHGWIKSIMNHLWYSSQNCNNDPGLLKEKWMSVMYHVTNSHEWDFFAAFHKCDHPDMSREEERKKKWLEPGSLPHEGLKRVILEAKLLKDVQKLNLSVHTGSLEVFHSLINKYCPKRQGFSYTGMVARTELAILDHNNNLSRKQATTSDGTLRYKVVYPKRTKEWVAKVITESKSHSWRLELTAQVFALKQGDLDVMSVPIPEGIPENIAGIEKPPKEVVVQSHVSRFHSND